MVKCFLLFTERDATKKRHPRHRLVSVAALAALLEKAIPFFHLNNTYLKVHPND